MPHIIISGAGGGSGAVIFSWKFHGTPLSGIGNSFSEDHLDSFAQGTSASGTQGVFRGDTSISGKKYFEMEYTTLAPDGGGRLGWGVANGSHTGNLGTTSNSVSVGGTVASGAVNPAKIISNGVELFTGLANIVKTDIIMGAVDSATGKVWLGHNGTWYNAGNPAAGTGEVATLTGTLYPAWGGQDGARCRGLRFTRNYAIPSGFTPL